MSAPVPRHGLAPLLAAAERCIASDGGRADPFPQPEQGSAMARLATLFELTAFEIAVVAAAAAVELVPGFGSACARAAGRTDVEALTPALAIARLPAARWHAFDPGSTLRRFRLVHVAEGPVFTARSCSLPESVLHFLMGRQVVSDIVRTRIRAHTQAASQPPSRAEAVARIVATLAAQPHPHVQLVTHAADDARGLATAAADACGRTLWVLPGWSLPETVDERDRFLAALSRDARMCGALILLDLTESTEPGQLRLACETAERIADPMLIAGADLVRTVHPVVGVPVGALPHDEAAALWRTGLEHAGLAAGDDAPAACAAQFRLAPESIAAAIESARHGDPAEPAERRVWRACRLRARAKLDDLAQRIEPDADDGRLVLPPAETATLRAVAAQVRHRARVFHSWGLASRGHRTGTSAIFFGPSGTGKTMAAEVLAHQLDLDLYRIDLSAVVSKFIGETEKNLRRVFDAADESGALLLFDEADALFGKRTEVKDSHDRHANVEVSYLLQRMETYQGLAILTTNLRKNIDDAFLRRIQFVVEFPFPTAELREEIWRHAFPPAMPLDGVDPALLARLAIAGGNIKTIARNAAFLAAADDSAVGMGHIMDATRREYAKLGRTLTSTETRGWLS